MVGTGVDRRGRGRAVAGAVFAFAVHLMFLGLLIVYSPGLVSGPPDARAISVDLVPPTRLLSARPPDLSRSVSARALPPQRASIGSQSVETVKPVDQPPRDVAAGIVPTPTSPPAATPQASSPPDLALRHSVIGCAFTGMLQLSEAERRHCHDAFAAGRKLGPDLSGFAVDPAKKAAFDAAAEREKFLQKPFLSQRPKNGCKPFVEHQQYATLGASRDAYSVSFGCGKTF